MNRPTPAIVTQRAAQRLPRLALLLFCAAYVVPGLFGRDPWRNADIIAFGFMHSLASGGANLMQPHIGGITPDAGLLPYWFGALAIQWLSPLLEPSLAARIPFGLLLVAVLTLTWYATYHLARTEAAQPVAFAFGGEAAPADYARSIADGALLALVATLGLLQLGHETTPELMQLTGVALLLYALAANLHRPVKARVAVLAALSLVAGSGSPSIAVALGLVAVAVCGLSEFEGSRRFAVWAGASTLLAAAVATGFDAWGWRAGLDPSPSQVLRLFAWFTWPAWPLAGWTLWRWRGHLSRRHIAVPLWTATIAMLASIAMSGKDRALLLALPSLAVLAAFSLPTLKRAVASAIDWFSVFFFSFCALAVWVIYLSMQLGIPAKPAANIARLAPGFEPNFSLAALIAAALATLAWLWLVRWRAGRNRVALWRSLVLPASGVALCWLLLMTLWLPVLDYARSERPIVERLARHLPAQACIEARDLPLSQLAALQALGGLQLRAVTAEAEPACTHLLTTGRLPGTPPAGFEFVARERRPTDRQDWTFVWRRTGS